MRSDWLQLILDADGITDYRESVHHHHRVDWFSRFMSFTTVAGVGLVIVAAGLGVAAARPSVTAEQDALRARVHVAQQTTLAAEREYLNARASLLRTQAAVRPDINGELASAVDAASVAAAYTAVSGPGAVITLNNARRPTYAGTVDLGRVIDRDVQHIVNALWQAGAEGVSINDIRLTNRTAIRNAGNAILVDYQPVTLPLHIRAIGDPSGLHHRFMALPEWDELTQLRDRYRIRWSLAASRHLVLPAGISVVPALANTKGTT